MKIKIHGGEILIDKENLKLILGRNWYLSGKTYPYAVTNEKGKNGRKILLHRLIMNCPKKMVVDHINGNARDNRKSNLRICTFAENSRNKALHKRSTTGIKGVSWDKHNRRWRVSIMINYHSINLGRFKSKKEAAKTYQQAAHKYFGEYARVSV